MSVPLLVIEASPVAAFTPCCSPDADARAFAAPIVVVPVPVPVLTFNPLATAAAFAVAVIVPELLMLAIPVTAATP